MLNLTSDGSDLHNTTRSTANSFTPSFLIFSVVSLSTYLIIKKFRDGSKRYELPLPPSLPSLPILGSFPFMGSVNGLPDFFRMTSQRLGPVFGVTVGSEFAVVLNTRKVVTEALIKKAAAFSGRLPGYTTVHYLNPNRYGIVGKQYGSEFRRLHQLTLSILKEFGFGSRIMQERILVEVEELIDIIQEQNLTEFNPSSAFSKCTINVITSIVFGKRISQRDEVLEMLVRNFRGFIQGKRRHIDHCPALRFIPHFKAAWRESMENQQELIAFIEEYTASSCKSDRQSFARRYIEREGENYDRNELNFLIRDLLIAGSETTSATIQFAMIRMANNPELQKSLQQEIDLFVNKNDHVTLDEVNNMVALKAAILEVQRLHSAVPLALPHCMLTDAELEGFFIPKGTLVFPNIKSVHMDPELWEDPERFRPERFLDSQGHLKGTELIMPFSIGKRSCLGELLARQEILLIISNLLHRFTILPPEGQDSVNITENYLITLFPSPYKLRFVTRL